MPPIGFLSATVNGNSASGPGAELSVTAAPADALELGVNFSWSDLTVDSDVISGGVVLFDKGDRLNFSPEYSAGASAAYVFPLGNNGFEGRLSASASYTSEVEQQTLVTGVRRSVRSDDMLIARTSVSIRARDHWTATLFVDNVNDEQGSPTRFANSNFSDRDIRVRPRTIGLQLEYQY